MEKRNVTVTLEKAKEWYNSNNESLKEIALQAFSRDEIMLDFENITSFKEACIALGLNCIDISIIIGNIARFSRASAAMLKLNIIRKALNLGQGLHFAKNPENSYIYHPYNPLIAELVENLVSQLKGKDVHAVVEIISTIGILLDVKEVAAMMECFKVLMLKKMTKELLNKAERKESTTQDVVAALMLKALMEKD